MNRRLLKEWRGLVGPWCLALVAAWALPRRVLLYQNYSGDQVGFALAGIAPMLFAFAIALMAAVAFAGEYHLRTFGLLVSQPLPRIRLWGEKMLALVAALLVVGLVYYASFRHVSEEMAAQDWQEASWAGLFVVATLCSATFWALLARSSIGGMAFTLASQCLAVLLLELVLRRHAAAGEEFMPLRAGLVASGAVLYSAVFLWLGWKRFAGLQLPGSEGATAVGIERSAASEKLIGWLTPRPQGATANLCRKELRLQKPTFAIAGLFVLCWAVALLVAVVQPGQREFAKRVAEAATALYVPLAVLLAGSISISEEKNLGVAAWHLSFPAATARQWLLKFGMGLITAVLLALMLPTLLCVAARPLFAVGIYAELQRHATELWPILLVLLALFVLAFWASTLTENTMRAMVLAIGAGLAFVAMVIAGAAVASQLDGLETRWLGGAAIRLGSSPIEISGITRYGGVGALVIFAVILGLLVLQSLRHFRLMAMARAQVVARSGAVLGVCLLLTLWWVDLQISASRIDQVLTSGLQRLLVYYPSLGASHVLTAAQLDATPGLSPAAVAWLKHAKVQIFRNNAHAQEGWPADEVRVTFPDGATVSTYIYVRSEPAQRSPFLRPGEGTH